MVLRDLLKIGKYFFIPFVVYVLGWIFYFLGFFDSVFWFDDVMHVIGGLAAGCTYFFVLSYFEVRNYLKLNKFFRFLFVVSLVALTTIFYEFYQFFLALFTEISVQPSLEDTLFDLFLGMVGSFFALFVLEFKGYIESK